LGVHDHGGIVWDEFVGFWIAMAALPVTWQSLILGFVLFRLFDILKPWPISWLDRRVSGGFGIMIDDVIAGIAAAGVITLLTASGLI
jgi:phosphatidylglycerophosphatase A